MSLSSIHEKTDAKIGTSIVSLLYNTKPADTFVSAGFSGKVYLLNEHVWTVGKPFENVGVL